MEKSETRHLYKPQPDDLILKERARALARLKEEDVVEGGTVSVMTFPLGEESYGVEINLVREIQPLDSQIWSPVPCTPDYILGAVNIRGRIYSVMNVASFLGLPPRPLSEKSHVLLVQGGTEEAEGGMELSILADDCPQVAGISLAGINPPQATLSSRTQEYVRGITEDMLIILDLERLLSDPRIIVHEEV